MCVCVCVCVCKHDKSTNVNDLVSANLNMLQYMKYLGWVQHLSIVAGLVVRHGICHMG